MNHPDSETREYFARLIEERERQYQQQFTSLRTLMDERDRLYLANFKAAEVAVSAALVAAEKSVNTAFAASEKAVLKAEQAQKEYNERSNEFRGQLDDQAKTLMPRPETQNMFKAIEEKVSGVQNVAESKFLGLQTQARTDLAAIRESFDKSISGLELQIVALREARAAVSGKGEGINASWGVLLSVVSLLATLIIIGAFIYTSNRAPAPAPSVPAPQVYALPPAK